MSKKIKVILLRKVDGLGEAGEVKEVSAGYANNLLLPKGLVKVATPSAVSAVEAAQARAAQAAETELVAVEETAGKLEGRSFELSAKGSPEGTLYAAITPAAIAKELKANGFNVAAQQVSLPGGAIKEAGEHEAVVNLAHGLEARITIVVEAAS